MAICIKGHYSTNDKKDKGARTAKRIEEDWKEYSLAKARGLLQSKSRTLRAIQELHGVGMADRIKRETE